jgi:hypothetical protein
MVMPIVDMAQKYLIMKSKSERTPVAHHRIL